MEYDFNTLKKLYNRYKIKYDEKSKEYQIVDQGNGMIYNFSGIGAEKVKFAHFWVYASNFNRSQMGQNKDVNLAFSDNLREVYNIIMYTAVEAIQSYGHLCRKEVFEDNLSSNTIYVHANDVVEGLYSKENGFRSFEIWCQCAAKTTNLGD